jgi:hypothetical protein
MFAESSKQIQYGAKLINHHPIIFKLQQFTRYYTCLGTQK